MADAEQVLRATLAIAVSQEDRLVECALRAFEHGISRIEVFVSTRSPRGISYDALQKLHDRLADEALEARRGLPELAGPLSLSDLIGEFPNHDATILCWEDAGRRASKVNDLVTGAANPLIIIGPVDGFLPDEANTLIKSGAVAATLGPEVLDVEEAVSRALEDAGLPPFHT